MQEFKISEVTKQESIYKALGLVFGIIITVVGFINLKFNYIIIGILFFVIEPLFVLISFVFFFI